MAKPPPLKILFRSLLPATVRARLRSIWRRNAFSGDYDTWASARKASKGYEDQAVLAKVIWATRGVVSGQASWDRDGALFIKPALNLPLLSALRRIAAPNHGRLELIDFGGALGSTWRQHKPALSDLALVRWRVVEQSHYVKAGGEFADDVLGFYPTMEAALEGASISAVLLSSVLPYLESPLAVLRDIAARRIPHVIIDRTSFAADGRERIVVQKTPSELGGGSYPCWLFKRETLFATLYANYHVVQEWPGFDDVDAQAVFRGFHFERNV